MIGLSYEEDRYRISLINESFLERQGVCFQISFEQCFIFCRGLFRFEFYSDNCRITEVEYTFLQVSGLCGRQCSTAKKVKKVHYIGFLRPKKVDISSCTLKVHFRASRSSLWFKSYIFSVLIFSSTVYLILFTKGYHFVRCTCSFLHCLLVHLRKTSNSKIIAKRVLRLFWYWNHEKAKEIPVSDQENFLIKKRAYLNLIRKRMTRSFIFQHPLIKLTIFLYTSIQHHQVNK